LAPSQLQQDLVMLTSGSSSKNSAPALSLSAALGREFKSFQGEKEGWCKDEWIVSSQLTQRMMKDREDERAVAMVASLAGCTLMALSPAAPCFSFISCKWSHPSTCFTRV
jgi:hypothetical protein